MTIVGVDWTTNASSPALTRIGPTGANLAGHQASWPAGAPAVGSAGGTAWNAFGTWGNMRRCNLWDDGTPTAYYGDRCYTDTDVANMGQVMVRVPKFLYYVDISLANHKRYYVTDYSDIGQVIRKADDSGDYTLSAEDVYPAFVTGGTTLRPAGGGTVRDNIYIAAFEGYINSGKLESKAGVAPSSGTTQATYAMPARRALARARCATPTDKNKWENMSYNAYAMLQILYGVEYANWNAQAQIGQGVTGAAAKINTGATGTTGTDRGNASYGVTANDDNAMSYRGVENWYGNLLEYVDGANIKADHTPWIANHDFVDDTFTHPYIDTGYTMSNATASSCYNIVSIQTPNPAIADHTFLPATGAYNTDQYLCDGVLYGAAGNRCLQVGGDYTLAANALAGGPFFCFWSIGGAGSSAVNTGSRLMYMG